mmetsp:Transcript_21835/g.34480  ORF Transcript_21835/g.34480 Transcript_21835/m.34480 type:complete len:126 (-) Transcript_21835:10-387(-)
MTVWRINFFENLKLVCHRRRRPTVIATGVQFVDELARWRISTSPKSLKWKQNHQAGKGLRSRGGFRRIPTWLGTFRHPGICIVITTHHIPGTNERDIQFTHIHIVTLIFLSHSGHHTHHGEWELE